jgi:hypothetical protein
MSSVSSFVRAAIEESMTGSPRTPGMLLSPLGDLSHTSILYCMILIDLIHDACNRILVRMMFLFVFFQFSSSIEYHATLGAFYFFRRIASCSKSYLWDQDLRLLDYSRLSGSS